MNEKTAIWRQASELIDAIDADDAAGATAHINALDKLNPQVKAAALKLIQLTDSDDTFQPLFDAGAADTADNSSQQLIIGDRLDGYELTAIIGQGGMATVFKAQRTDSDVQKEVAIKVFNHSHLPRSFLQHFKNEQHILSRMDHNNIVSMHHNGLTEDGTAYIVMEYVHEAMPIDNYLTAEIIHSHQAIIALVAEIADALNYAHANLVVHRDIKPNNILVNIQGQIKLVDFGIAKMLQHPTSEESQTWVALTPHYAAPEQIKHNQVSVQSDVFSLAAVCLGLLINDKPLPDDRLLKQCATDEAMVAQHLKSGAFDQDLKNILNKALQQDPERRYKTMQSLLDDLSRWQDKLPVMATKDSWWYRMQKFRARRTALFGSIFTLIITTAIGVLALLWQIQKTQLEADKANTVKNFMLNTYSVVDPNNSQGTDITAKDLLAASYDEINHADSMEEVYIV